MGEGEEKMKHKGIFRRRIKYNDREKAFADLWEKENEAIKGLDYGYGILQNLMFKGPNSPNLLWGKWNVVFNITQREACIVATVIQWLGTNVGFCFVERALNKCGYRIERIK